MATIPNSRVAIRNTAANMRDWICPFPSPCEKKYRNLKTRAVPANPLIPASVIKNLKGLYTINILIDVFIDLYI